MSTLAVNQITTQTGDTITLPTGKKIVGTDAGSIVVPGQIIQVQTSTTSAQMSFTSTPSAWTDLTGMTVNITPKAVNNKILVTGVMYIGSNSNPNGGVRCYRSETSGGGNASAVGATGTSDGTYIRAGAFWNSDDFATGDYTLHDLSFQLEDTVPSTNQLTYKLQWSSSQSSGDVQYINRVKHATGSGQGTMSISVAEIAV